MKKLLTLLLVLPFNCIGQDTVRCIMQVSDTNMINGKWNNKVVWLKGYTVTDGIGESYLDVIKSPLPKGIVIWTTKQY